MWRFASKMLGLGFASISAMSCENCPDRSVALSITPTSMVRGSETTVQVTFPDAVFVEPPPAREADISVELHGPIDGDDAFQAFWRGRSPQAIDPALPRVTVRDDRTLEVTIAPSTALAVGRYELVVIGDSAGACEGANGAMELTIR